MLCNGAGMAFTRDAFMRHSGNLQNHLALGMISFSCTPQKEKKGKILWLQSQEAAVTHLPPVTEVSDQSESTVGFQSGSYTDPFTIILAIVTFFTNVSLQFCLQQHSTTRPFHFCLWLSNFHDKSICRPLPFIASFPPSSSQTSEFCSVICSFRILYPFI